MILFLIMKLNAFAVCCVAVASLLAAPAWSQPATPSTEQMIDQLRAPAPLKTRGLRNLSVEAVPADAAQNPAVPAPRPSLSLQIQFDFNSATIRPESQQALMNLAQALQSPELKDSGFAVEGHTDAKGKADYNLRLSEQRAQAVKRFLAQQGVADARLQASGKGSTQLANASDPYAAENRRVRIVNLD